MKPKMVFADPRGAIFNHPYLECLGREWEDVLAVPDAEWVPVPEGTKLFTLPGRLPLGWNPDRRSAEALEEVERKAGSFRPVAVSAFLPAGYTRSFLPAARALAGAPVLPLWAYGAVGWADGRFWSAGIRVDEATHWDAENYDDRELLPLVGTRLEGSGNRLLAHLKRCATEFHCLAAKNLFYGRWECPLPVSPVCNADCVGCLSLQPEGKFPASHERLTFLPSVEEVVEIAVPHLEKAPEAVVSFGQGCEGEPLLQADLLAKVIRAIRRATRRGVIHINTNASHPRAVAHLAEAGLDSIRVSLNSAREGPYALYYRPRGYGFKDVRDSLRLAADSGLFTSINLLTFPGFTDTPSELAALLDLVRETGLAMIQWKNLNIDPELYLSLIGPGTEPVLGMRRAMERVREAFPGLLFGYFNRPREKMGEKLLPG